MSAAEILAEIGHEILQNFLNAVRGSDDDKDKAHEHLLRWNNLVEIQGPAASGKTHITYLAVMICILPPRHYGVKLGGWGRAAILLDTDVTFDVHRLQHLMEAYILRRSEAVEYPSRTLQQIVQEALSRLHVFQPDSSVQLAATILHVQHYHAETPSLADLELGLLVIDSLSAFYWEDRFTIEQLRSGSSSDARTPFRHVLSAIDTFRAHYSCPILVTNWGLTAMNAAADSDPSPFFKQHLYPFHPDFVISASSDSTTDEQAPDALPSTAGAPPPNPTQATHNAYTLALTHHITLPQVHLPPIPPNVHLADAFSEEENHQHLTVPRGEIHGLIRVPGNPHVSKFTCSISETSVDVEPGRTFV